MPKHHYQQYGTIENHLHHVHTPQGQARGGGGWEDFWGGVGDFFVHTIPEKIIPFVVDTVSGAMHG